MKYAIPLYLFAAMNVVLSVYSEREAMALANEAFDPRQVVCIGLVIRSMHLGLSALLFVFIATLVLLHRRKPVAKESDTSAVS